MIEEKGKKMNKILGYERYTFIISTILSAIIGIVFGSWAALDIISSGAGIAGFIFLFLFSLSAAASFLTLTGFSGLGFFLYNTFFLKKEDDLEDHFPNDGWCVGSMIIGAFVMFLVMCWAIGSFFSCIV